MTKRSDDRVIALVPKDELRRRWRDVWHKHSCLCQGVPLEEESTGRSAGATRVYPLCASTRLAQNGGGKEFKLQTIVLLGLKRFSVVLLDTLREIFDESAYERFLQRAQATRSVESYGAFLREREAGMLRKPRCC